MKECDILWGSKHALTPPTYFRGSGPLPQTHMIYTPANVAVKILIVKYSDHIRHGCYVLPLCGLLRVRLSVCLSGCLSVHRIFRKTCRRILTKIFG